MSHQPASAIERSPETNDYALPTLRPTYPIVHQTQGPLVPDLGQPAHSQMPPQPPLDQMLPPTEGMIPNDAILQAQVQAQVDDYLKAADELSNYMTWDMTQLPSWVDFGGMMGPT